jgi:hypothetical protein
MKTIEVMDNYEGKTRIFGQASNCAVFDEYGDCLGVAKRNMSSRQLLRWINRRKRSIDSIPYYRMVRGSAKGWNK